MKTSQSPPPSAPPLAPLHLQALPLRLQYLVTQLLAHGEVLCAYPTGSIEFHFSHAQIKVKLTLVPDP